MALSNSLIMIHCFHACHYSHQEQLTGEDVALESQSDFLGTGEALCDTPGEQESEDDQLRYTKNFRFEWSSSMIIMLFYSMQISD